jgi:D-3-phosphoglycerate dehydrogenase
LSSKLKILIAESREFSPEACGVLSSAGDVTLADLDHAALCEAVADVDLLWVRLRNRVDRAVLQNAVRLQAIATPTTGLNHIHTEEANRRGVQVFSLRGETEFLKNVRATAEHTIALTFALLRHIPQAVKDTDSGRWNRDLFRGSELYGKTVGVVGYGRLGRLVGRYFHVFGANVIASDPNVPPSEVEDFVELAPLESLLSRSDIVTVHVNLNEHTERMFGHRQFQCMKPGAWFVNTARGELVDEIALLEALQSGHLSGAGLDVLRDETSGHLASNPLLRYATQQNNLLITPHIGGCTVESMAKTEIFLAEKIVTAFSTHGTLRELHSMTALAV